ncbi:uncharacterized protein PpBr36_05736 [Pyricularia pennisetigena]|uniref:uncharacterized protein n=1 Tax=Pyricularia pennisetigena TaxID=1578925 RepID=UPI00115282AE|nr:uncharacterized protein PpBr36_05736 [Pyricularia pennisetigena]TLS22817.1 hypothetical protein PpBr36_05736 [Pyricularia pennisetigena]
MFGVSFSFRSCTCYCQASERKSPPYSLPFVRFFSRGVECTSKATVLKVLAATRNDWIRIEEKGGRGGGGGEDDDGGGEKEEVQTGKEDVEVIRSKELEDNWDEQKGLDEIGPGLPGLC